MQNFTGTPPNFAYKAFISFPPLLFFSLFFLPLISYNIKMSEFYATTDDFHNRDLHIKEFQDKLEIIRNSLFELICTSDLLSKCHTSKDIEKCFNAAFNAFILNFYLEVTHRTCQSRFEPGRILVGEHGEAMSYRQHYVPQIKIHFNQNVKSGEENVEPFDPNENIPELVDSDDEVPELEPVEFSKMTDAD